MIQQFSFRRFILQVMGIVMLMSTHQFLYSQGMMATPEERAQRLKDRLALTDEQTKQVTRIFSIAQKEMGEKRDSLQGDRAAMRSAMMDMMSKTDKKIEKILTTEQKKKYEELKKERRQQRRQRPGEN